MTSKNAPNQNLFTLMAIVGIALGGFLIGSSVYFSSTAPASVTIMQEIPDGEVIVVPIPNVEREEELRFAVQEHFKKFEARNFREETDGLLADYSNSQDTLVEWTGVAAGFYSGTYRGFNSLRILYASVLGNTETIDMEITEYQARIDDDLATATMHLTNIGEGKLIGEFQMEIDVVMTWILNEESRWVITDEIWVFEVFRIELVAEGTVFPLHWSKRGDFSIWDGRGVRLSSP